MSDGFHLGMGNPTPTYLGIPLWSREHRLLLRQLPGRYRSPLFQFAQLHHPTTETYRWLLTTEGGKCFRLQEMSRESMPV